MTDALTHEVQALTDRIYGLLNDSKNGANAARRVVLNVPEEWVLLAAWLEMRIRMRRGGNHGPSPLRIEDGGNRLVSALARSFISALMNEHLDLELIDLATGGHRYLRAPEPPAGEGSTS